MRRAVMAIVYRMNGHQREFLMLHRTKDQGGFWQPVVGKALDSESDMTTIYRELDEEISISREDVVHVISKVYRFKVNKHHVTGKKIPTVMVTVYGIEIGMDTSVDISYNPDKEHDRYSWEKYHNAGMMLKWPDDLIAMARLQNMILDEYDRR